MKLCYINITEEEITGPYLDILKKTAARVLDTETEMSIKSVKPGLTRAFDIHPYFLYLNKRSIIERAIEAQAEGFDAVVVGCFADPGVKEARATVDIPVIGIAEASMLYACMIGRKFAIVTINEPSFIPEMEDMIRYYGMQSRAISNPVRMIKISNYDAFTKGMQEPGFVAKDIYERAVECAADRADVVIVGCNGLGPLCTLAGLVKVDKIDVPILDCISVGLKMAETVCEVSNKLGIPYISRNGSNALPSNKSLKRVRKNFALKDI